MNPHRRFWDELLRVTEESYAAFSGINPDLIADSHMILKIRQQDGNREASFRCRLRRSAEASAFRGTIEKSKTEGEGR